MPQHDTPSNDYRYGETGKRIRAAIADAEARGDHDAVLEHEDQLNELRIETENSGVLTVEPPGYKRNVPNDPVVAEHGDWECRESQYEDGDGFSTPDWMAYRKTTGDSRIIHHSRFAFHMTPARFRWLVENDFPRPERGNWTDTEIDAAMEDGA